MTTSTFISLLSTSIHAIFSLHFFYLVGMFLLLLRNNFSNRTHNILLFLSIFSYFLLFHGNSLHIFQMAGDNVCQIAYWKTIFHPNLTGSIGASYTKPGQLLILGILYELSTIFGEIAFKAGLCLIMASCVCCLSRIATEISGRGTGIVVFLAASWVFLPEFVAGSYSIFLIPAVFTGLWLYYFKPDKKVLGRLLLVLSIQFHIQAITVLAVVWLIHLVKKEWKELAAFSAAAACSLALWIVAILRVQGAFDRINSGATIGYVAPFGEVFSFDSKLDYILKAVTTELSSNYTIGPLLILAVIGVAGSYCTRFKIFLSVFSIIILLVINVVLLNGSINLGRYFSLIYAFSCSVGVATLLQMATPLFGRQKFLLAWLALIPSVLMLDSSRLHLQQQPLPDYITSASTLLHDSNMPFSTRLMTEDDLLYPIVAQFPDRYPSITALQYFNVANEAKRKQILSRTDYIWIMTNNRHPYYYLSHLPLPEWQTDKFRLMIYEMMQDHRPKSLYDFIFIPIEIGGERLLIQVKPSKMA